MSIFVFQSRKYESVGPVDEVEVVDRVPPL